MSLRLGLGIICKDEVEKLDAILKDYKQFFDDIQITITSQSRRVELEKLIEEHGGKSSYFDWVNDFAAARNFNKSLFKDCQYYFTLDCDDRLVNAEKIRSVANKALEQDLSIIYCPYVYSLDEFGNPNAVHHKERIIKLDENLYWNKKIHENVLPKSADDYKTAIEESIQVLHKKSAEDYDKSSARNLEYLLKEYSEDKEKTDPRTLAYLGRTFFTSGDFKKAVYFLEKHIEKSGWDEDRFYSWCVLAEIYRHKEDYKTAIACAFEALAERADYPDAYLKLHDIYQEQGKWDKAIEWGNMGLAKPMPRTFLLIDPSSYTWRPALSMAFCHFQLGNYEKAKSLFDYAKKLAPGLDYIKNQSELFNKAFLHEKFMEKFIWILKFIKEHDKNPTEKAARLIESVPDELNEHEGIARLRASLKPPRVWDDKSIVFLCGNVLEEWSPKSVEKGIGGSEEAVIYLSKELVKQGYKVTVYNTCGENEGIYDGVEYVNNYRFNKHDTFNILISWRINMFKYGLKAKKKLVWLHDVPGGLFTKKSDVDCVDKILVLSEFHKSLLPDFAKAKAVVTSNGINVEDTSKVARQSNKVIYASSYDRGLEYLLGIWPQVVSAVPKAELHVYYGWNNMDKLIKEGHLDGRFKEKIQELLNQPGVIHHGRVGHKELAEAFAGSAVWAYPTEFPEISCITAMKAQTYGAVPLCSNFGALEETVQYGGKLGGKPSDEGFMDDFAEQLIYALQHPEELHEVRQEALDKAKEYFAWTRVAKEWHEIFSTIQERSFINNRFDWIKDKCLPNDKIVDIGGNDGHTFDNWNRNNVTTVDLDLYDIPNFVRANAESLPLADKSFDVAVLAEILEHVENPVQALKEAKRVARKVIVTVPEEHEWAEHLDPFGTADSKAENQGLTRLELAKVENKKCKEFYDKDNLDHLWHQRHYTAETLTKDLEAAGFKDFKIEKLTLGEWVFYGAVLNS